ncbi:LysR family transcriptional regulator [Prosthecodimorpha staleyi]|uniref:LysR family transcriptional regulator n=1 Tax=Prosthecodimorpha staleyi TaxID=2840188 RepID=UPI0021C4BFC4|nr:LysR family transcriptional regulator [Prosthecodimorpha staleyi]
MLPSLNALVAFEAAVRCGTFSKAAKELGVTSPAISRMIGRLELHLGLQLFRRTPSGVVLTEEGDRLFSSVSGSFDNIERTVIELVDRKRMARRPIVLSVSAAFATHWFLPRLARFQARFPGEEIQFQLINGSLEGAVDGVDIAMRFDPGPTDDFEIFPLMRELLLPVCAAHYEGARGDAGALIPAAARMITLSGSPVHWEMFFASGDNRPATNEMLFTDYSLVIQAALVGQGIAVGWFNVISSLLARTALVPARPEVVATKRRCDLVLRKRRHPAVVNEICHWIAEEYRSDASRMAERHPDLAAALLAELPAADTQQFPYLLSDDAGGLNPENWSVRS